MRKIMSDDHKIDLTYLKLIFANENKQRFKSLKEGVLIRRIKVTNNRVN